jgi:phosphatidylglycerophosphate synthase
MDRRPIKTRSRRWPHVLSTLLVRTGLSPNQVSLIGIAFAILAAGLMIRGTASGTPWHLVGAAAAIQLRLLCNMLDGLMAVEGGKRSKTGDFFNDFPDRIEDAVILLGAGYAAQLPIWGWAATASAMLTAYVRVLGGAMGLTQDFCGPMAKPQRMFVITVASLGATLEIHMAWPSRALQIGLGIVILGALITAIRRITRVLHALENR